MYSYEFDVLRRTSEQLTGRPCPYPLVLGDVAFADFGLDENGCLFIIRISFDGYGCCTVDAPDIGLMSPDDSKELIKSIESGQDLSTDHVRALLRRYFEAQRDVIWEKALIEYGLVAATAPN